MHHHEFIKQIDDKRVIAAIQQAESKSAAQVRVFISHHHIANALQAAHEHFLQLGMQKTRNRNAVLIFIAPQSRKLAIYGDIAIDEKCGTQFWETVRDETIAHLKAGDFTSAIIHAIDRVGEKLAEHFPSDGPPSNELPDAIASD